MSNHPAAGPAVAAYRIPLFKVEVALRRASASYKARAALRAALALVPTGNWPLYDAIHEVASTSGWDSFARQCFDRTATGAPS